MRLPALSSLGSVALLLFATPLLADEGGVGAPPAPPADTYSLSWVRQAGAEECVSDQQLARLIEQIVGPVLRAPSASTLQIEGVVGRASQGFHVMIRVTDARGDVVGERELATGDARCSSLTPSILLVLAVIVDPDVLSRGLGDDVLRTLEEQRANEPKPAPREESSLPQEPAPASEPAPKVPVVERADSADARSAPRQRPPVEERARERDNATHLFAAGALGLGFTPRATPGFVLGLLRELAPDWALRVESAYWFPQAATFDSLRSEGGTIDFDAFQIAGSLCARAFHTETTFVRGCIGGLFGERRVTAEPLVGTETTYRSYFGPSVGGEAFWAPKSFWFARAAVELGHIVRDDRFVYTDHENQPHELYEPTRFPASFSLGAGVRL